MAAEESNTVAAEESNEEGAFRRGLEAAEVIICFFEIQDYQQTSRSSPMPVCELFVLVCVCARV